MEQRRCKLTIALISCHLFLGYYFSIICCSVGNLSIPNLSYARENFYGKRVTQLLLHLKKLKRKSFRSWNFTAKYTLILWQFRWLKDGRRRKRNLLVEILLPPSRPLSQPAVEEFRYFPCSSVVCLELLKKT